MSDDELIGEKRTCIIQAMNSWIQAGRNKNIDVELYMSFTAFCAEKQFVDSEWKE